MTNVEIQKEVEECKKQGMPNFLIAEHIQDLIMEEESEEEE
jgi:hypothetical protein